MIKGCERLLSLQRRCTEGDVACNISTRCLSPIGSDPAHRPYGLALVPDLA